MGQKHLHFQQMTFEGIFMPSCWTFVLNFSAALFQGCGCFCIQMPSCTQIQTNINTSLTLALQYPSLMSLICPSSLCFDSRKEACLGGLRSPFTSSHPSLGPSDSNPAPMCNTVRLPSLVPLFFLHTSQILSSSFTS